MRKRYFLNTWRRLLLIFLVIIFFPLFLHNCNSTNIYAFEEKDEIANSHEKEISFEPSVDDDQKETSLKEREQKNQKNQKEKKNYWAATFKVTAYSSTKDQTDSDPFITASGAKVYYGAVAVDTNLIPFGTKLEIPGYGIGIAEDRGSAIKGHCIDVWMPSREEALEWGVRYVKVKVYLPQ